MLNNLLTNAVKFSYPQSAIKIYSREHGERRTALFIEDSGIGMSERLLGDLFNVSKTTSREGTAGEQGTGFGMPLVHKFMLAYNGEINIYSKDKRQHPQDHGTRVKLIFDTAPNELE